MQIVYNIVKSTSWIQQMSRIVKYDLEEPFQAAGSFKNKEKIKSSVSCT